MVKGKKLKSGKFVASVWHIKKNPLLLNKT